jgi:site-specific DNA-methyltransferase (adenine-specific)
MNNKLHFGSDNQTWETPLDFYDKLNEEFNFTLDPCCSKETAKCKKYFTEEDNGLIQDWSEDTVFMNPPYGREIKHWIAKAHEEYLKGATVVCLIPSRTDTIYWHKWIFPLYYNNKIEIRFLKGRLKFGGATNPAPFPSALIVFDNRICGSLNNPKTS